MTEGISTSRSFQGVPSGQKQTSVPSERDDLDECLTKGKSLRQDWGQKNEPIS